MIHRYTDGEQNHQLEGGTYRRLIRVKGEGESFSDVIDRLLEADDHPLYGLIGLLEPDQVATLRERSRGFRDNVDDRMGAESN